MDAFGYGALNAWSLGRPDIVRQRLTLMEAIVDQNNPSHLATASCISAWLHLSMREYERAEALALEAARLSDQHQFPVWAAAAKCYLGAARAQLARAAEGVALLLDGTADIIRLGVYPARSVFFCWLAEARGLQGATLDALETIGQALEANPEELIYRPEALRVRGELRVQQRATEAAVADFRDAIELAQKMGAKMWELRATISFVRLLAKQGRRDEARSMLAEIYNWFTEGSDTVDLKEAKALLDELSR